MPGVSRSGITITAARFLGLDRDSAARFSFLLLIPIVFGAVLWKGVTDVLLGDLPPGSAGPFVVGVIASAASGLLAIWALLGYVRSHSYTDLRRLPPRHRGVHPPADRGQCPRGNLLNSQGKEERRQRWRELHRERPAVGSLWRSGRCCSARS